MKRHSQLDWESFEKGTDTELISIIIGTA